MGRVVLGRVVFGASCPDSYTIIVQLEFFADFHFRPLLKFQFLVNFQCLYCFTVVSCSSIDTEIFVAVLFCNDNVF